MRRTGCVGRCGPRTRLSVDRASTRLAHSSLGGSEFVSVAASAAPPSMAAGMTAQLARAVVGWLQRALKRLRSTGSPPGICRARSRLVERSRCSFCGHCYHVGDRTLSLGRVWSV